MCLSKNLVDLLCPTPAFSINWVIDYHRYFLFDVIFYEDLTHWLPSIYRKIALAVVVLIIYLFVSSLFCFSSAYFVWIWCLSLILLLQVCIDFFFLSVCKSVYEVQLFAVIHAFLLFSYIALFSMLYIFFFINNFIKYFLNWKRNSWLIYILAV